MEFLENREGSGDSLMQKLDALQAVSLVRKLGLRRATCGCNKQQMVRSMLHSFLCVISHLKWMRQQVGVLQVDNHSGAWQTLNRLSRKILTDHCNAINGVWEVDWKRSGVAVLISINST